MALKKTNSEFLKELKIINPNIKVLGSYVNAKTKILCKCNKCNSTWSSVPDSLLHGTGCPVCAGKNILIGYNDIWTTNHTLASMLADPDDGYKYTQYSNKKVDWKCPDCGNVIKNRSISNVNKHGLSCNICGDGISFPEKFMISILNQLKIEYIFQYCPDWIKPKRYDFYIPSMQKIIEMDGEFHFKDNGISGQSKFISNQIDEYKDKMAELHNIKIIRIDCNYRNQDRFIYVKNKIFKSEIKDILNLYFVNWKDIYKDIQKNLVYEICIYKNSHSDLSTTKIASIYKLNKSTVITYLKCGNKLNWCSYNPKEEMRKSGLYQMSMIKNRNTKVICITTGVIYNSIQEAEQAISCKGISDCCRHKHHYTGTLSDGTKLVWMYYDEYLESTQFDKNLSA